MTPKQRSGTAAGAAAAFPARASGKVIFRKLLRFMFENITTADYGQSRMIEHAP
jgi:hypothetical protein